MANIGIFVGTVYGNALAVGETALQVLEQAGHNVALFDEPELDDWQTYAKDTVLIITSTTGQGDLPDNIVPLFNGLRDVIGYQPFLHYGVIALGDSSYDNFTGAGRQFDELLTEQQATRIGEMYAIDAMEVAEPEIEAKEWLTEWVKLVE